MSTMNGYPVRVDADLQPGLSRWLWLVKWVLVIPHYFVLAFLWMSFVVLSVFAFVAILVTGHYPRSIFEFNVGVLRWSWRVSYYAYGSLGTDQYPPFTLAERPDYPAHLEVAYPERLSRGLVLVKWWLLAIPHYLVLGVFLGGWYLTYTQDSRWNTPGGGLIGLLVLVAAVVLLFTGRYPQSIFDLVLGMNRWVLRVAAYAALMTDEYPPFRLDLGGTDPGATRIAMPAGGSDPFEGADQFDAPASDPAGSTGPSAPPATPPTATYQAPRNEWGAGRVTAVVIGAVVLLVSLGLIAAGATLGIADRFFRDSQGFLMAPQSSLSSPGSALVSPNVQVQAQPASTLPRSVLGTAKVTVDPAGGGPVFAGIARTGAAAGYLAGVARSTVLTTGPHPSYQFHQGGLPGRPPSRAGIWVASSAGSGLQTVTWPVRNGDWTLVVMNADGSRGVAADVRAGATVPIATWLFASFLIVGFVLLAIAVVTLVAALSRPRAPAATGPPPA
ncbi:MAG TPA: DUF4389 domain-containing protein [Nocardioidaceae bacterium]|nr:DUF4389 domain-containing protein [Nocardioidaceae bacterium]